MDFRTEVRKVLKGASFVHKGERRKCVQDSTCIQRILKTVLRFVLLQMTEALAQPCNKCYNFGILTVEKAIWGWSNEYHNVTTKQAISFTIPMFLIQIIPLYCSGWENRYL